MATTKKISKKELNDALARSRQELKVREAQQTGEKLIDKRALDAAISESKTALAEAYTPEVLEQLRAEREAYSASLRPGETRRGSQTAEDGTVIPGARWNPAKRQVNATVRSADEIRKDIAAVDEEIRAANHGSIKSDLGVLLGGHTNTMVPAERIAQLNENRKRLRQELAANRSALKNNADFAEKNQADAGFAAMTDDDMYRLVNYPEQENDLVRSPAQAGVSNLWPEELRGDVKANETLKNLIDPIYSAIFSDTQYIKSMTDEERQNYNYLYKTEGRAAADEYLELIKDGLTERYTEETNAKMKEFAEEHPVMSSAYTVATLPAKGASALGGSLGTYLSGQELDRNGSYNILANASSEIRRTVSNQVEEKWGKVGSAAYNIGMSMADFLALGVIGKGTQIPLAILGSNAAADMTISALDRGLSDDKAIALGLVAGIAEAAMEKIGIDNLFKNPNWNKNSLLYVFQNVFGELLEEGGTSLVNSLADILISRDKSEWQQSINAYTEQGFTDKEAFWQTLKDTAGMIGLDALGGAISGGLMAGGGVAIAKTGQAATKRESSRQVQDAYWTAVNDSRMEAEDVELNTFQTDKPYTETPEADAVFKIGSDPEYGQLMTLAEQDKAKAIEAAPDDLTKTTIKYGASRDQYNQAKALAKITGKDIVFFEQEGENGTVKNGFYKPSEDRIYLNVRSKNAVPVTVAHELTHTLQETGGYGDLQDIVFAEMQRTGKNIGKLRTEKAELYAKAGEDLATQEKVDQEIVSEFAEKFLNDVSKIREIYREKPSLAKKITRALDRMLIRATGMQDQTAKAYLERASTMYHRVDEIVENSEEEINRRLDEQEAAQASGGESAAQTGASPAKETAPAVPQNTGNTGMAGGAETQNPSEPAEERRTAPQTSGTASGGVSEGTAANGSQEDVRTSMDESEEADRMLEDLNRRYENGELTDEEYDEAYELIEEARLTGRGIESSATVFDTEGKIQKGIKGIFRRGQSPQYSADEIEDEARVQWSISEDEFDTENGAKVDRYADMTGKSIFRSHFMKKNQGMVDAIVKNRAQTKTEAFRNWFGDSKVTNADGEPLLVFRGTSATTAKLDHDDKPIWFSNNVMYAEKYSDDVKFADKIRKSSQIFGGAQKKIIPAYIRAINPADFGDTDGSFTEKLPELSRNLMIPEDELRNVWDETGRKDTVWETLHTSEVKDLLASYGYDSVKAVEFGVDTWAVFDSHQAKSAVANNGKFNADNPDIRYSISEDGDATPYGSLPVKAQTRVRDLERDFGKAMDKMFGLGMTYKSPAFRQFIQDNLRPLVNVYLETGSVPQEDTDALFGQFFNPLAGADETLQRQEFYNAFEQMEDGLRAAARYAESMQTSAEPETETNPLPTTEEAEELFRAQRDARREMDKVMYRLLLTPGDEVKVGQMLRGQLSADQIDSETNNKADILEAYRVQKAFNEADAAVSVYKKRLKAELYRHVDSYLENIGTWKDKVFPLLYQRETMERNIRDIIPDKAEADAFIAEFITPVHRAEAQRQRFLGEYRDRVRKLNLSAKVQKGNAQSEAYAVQLLGEAQDNIRILSLTGKRDQTRDGHTLSEWQLLVDNFWDENPNMDRAKIQRGIDEFRKIYNELLPKINEVRIRNGYAPVAFRQGYFPHFTAASEDTLLAKMLHPFGIQFNADALPTSINGLTADFKPGITYFQFGNQRLGFETTYDALQGYEMYLNAASDVIYHTDNIQKLRALATRIRYLTGDEGVKQQIDKVRNNDSLDEAEKQVQLEEIYRKGRYRMSNFVIAADEYTNSLANKKSRFDRGVEELFGRPAYSVIKSLESRVAANMIAGNIGSALTNIIPLNQANAIIGNVNVLKGMYHTVRGTVKDDGFAAMSDFLTNRRGSDSLVRTTGQKISDAASIPMNLIDNFVSETIVRAAYTKNLADGMGEALALQHADSLAASIMADRSKGALPLLFNARNPLMKLFTQFQVEVNNEYSVIFKDIPELAKADSKTRAGAAARIAGMLFKYLVGAWIFNDLYEKLFGRRAALDPVEMLNNAVGGISGYQVPNVADLAGEALSGDLTAEDFAVERQDPGKVLQTLGTEAAESLPFIGGVLGGGRVPIQSALPDLANLTMAATSDTWTGKKKALTAFEELSKPAAYLLPPFGGGQIQKMLRGGAAAAQGGVYGVEGDEDGGTYLKYPVYDNWQDQLNAIVFGTTYTEGGREWVESGFKSLSVKQTTAYQAMKEFGADDRAAYDLIQAYKAVPDGEGKSAAQRDVIRNAEIPGEAKYAAYYNLGASDARRALMDAIADTEPTGNLGEAAEVLMDISDIRTGKTAGTCDLLAQSGLTEETKKRIYRQEVSDQRDDDIAAVAWAGITFDEYLDAHGAYSAIGSKDLSKSEQALEFSRYVDGMNFSDAQKDTMREIFKYYSQVPVQAKNYNELRDLGISDDYAAKLVRAVDELSPLPGEKSVSSIQKARVVVDTISDADDRLAALGTVLSDSQYRKVSIAADAGLDPEVWVAFREILPEFDSDSNGSYTQEEMEDAIRAFSGGSNYGTTLMKAARNLSRDEMAILWQIGGSWKSANNPFSKTTGKRVKDLLDAEKKG